MSDPLAALRAVSGTDLSSGATTLPNIPAVPYTDDASLTNILSAMKLWMDKAAGSGLTGFASKQDLIDAGVLSKDPSGNLKPTADTSMAVPPVPTGLTASGAMTIILLEWDDPRLAYSNHGYTEVWAAETDNFTNAVLVGQGAGFIFSHAVGEDSTRYYWIRFVSSYGIKGPYNSVNGTLGQTAPNPQYLLDTLTGQLTESQLYADLSARIDLIDGPSTTIGTIPFQLAQLQGQINDLSNYQTYDNATTYATGDIVTYNGVIYKAKSTTTGNLPTNTTYWLKIGDYSSLADVANAIVQTQATANTAVTNAEAAQGTADSKVRTYAQAEEPTADLVTGDLWIDTGDNNRLYRWNGSDWVYAADVRITNTASLVTDIQTTVNDHTNSIQTNAESIDGIQGKYTVKIDNNGYVTGYGLISEDNNGTPTSEFMVVADKFSIAHVASNSNADSPFFHLTSPTTINGVEVPAGTYMKSAFIHDAAITNAQIHDLAADKITAGTIDAARIGANSITADKINGTNLAVVNGTFSGSLQAATGTFTGALSAATGTFSGRLTAGTIDPGAFAGIVQNYGTPGTYTITVPTGTGWSAVNMRFTIQGAGGGGGGGAASANERKGASGGGGGAGSAINVTLNNLAPGATYTLVVGAGGAGGPFSSIGQPGGSGGATSLAGYSAPGGGGGGGGNPYGGGSAGAGGSIGGTSGSVGPESIFDPIPFLPGGRGGSSAYGAGGGSDAGGGVGAGGGGGSAGSGDVDRGGAPGGNGYAIVEFYDPNAVVTNTRYSNLITWLDTIGHGAVPANAR